MKFLGIELSPVEEAVRETADVKTALELQKLRSAQLENHLKVTELATGWANFVSRVIFSLVVFALMVWWLNFVQNIIQSVAFNWAHLSDAVLIALITTTTANVLGLWAIVANYLYQKRKEAEAAAQSPARRASSKRTEPPTP